MFMTGSNYVELEFALNCYKIGVIFLCETLLNKNS